MLVYPTSVEDLDRRKNAIRTVVEASYTISISAIYAEGERELFYFVYADGALERRFMPKGSFTRFDGDYENELFNKEHLPNYAGGLEDFLDKSIRDPKTLGYIAMDTDSYEALKKRKRSFRDYNKWFVGEFGIALVKPVRRSRPGKVSGQELFSQPIAEL